tara:strand:+ start:762 stop:1361 length:600 start_codon:yes stop_codon:yes gene_type:complete
LIQNKKQGTMKLKSYYLLVVFSLLLLSVTSATTQNSLYQDTTTQDTTTQDTTKHLSSSEFVGKIFIDGKKAKDVIVKVFDDNVCLSEYKTKNNGKFVFTADCEKHYTLQFEKEGYVAKRVIVKTYKTEDLDHFTKRYKFDITLNQETEDMDYSVHDFPIAIIEIDNDLKYYKFNRRYTKNRLREIELNEVNKISKNNSN